MRPSDFEILYEDNHLLVVNKPAGVATMGVGPGEASLWRDCCEYIRRKYNKPGNVYLGVVSRLDLSVSGVIVFARTSKAAARLCEQFREGTAKKVYWALVNGTQLPPAKAELNDWMIKDDSRHRMLVSSQRKSDWLAVKLEFTRLSQVSSSEWLLEIKPHTGRKHQIRAQLAAAGWPIRGDRKYGSETSFPMGIGLHSYSLTLLHPTQKRELYCSARPPKTWKIPPNVLN